MPDPKQPTAAEKLMMLQQLGQQYVASGQAPSPQVQVALRSFNTAPTPEEIQKTADDFVRAGNPAAAVEFQAFASAMAAPQNKLRADMQQRADAGVGPSPPVVQALNSFDEPPTTQDIQTMRRYLQKTYGEAVGQEFETYAATGLANTPLPPSARPDQVTSPARQPQQAPVTQAGPEPGLVAAAKRTLLEGPGTDALVAAGQDIGGRLFTGPGTDALVAAGQDIGQRAKRLAMDTGQGLAHLFTLGKVPAPERMKEGNDVLRGAVGLEPLQKKPRQGKTEGYDEKPRDKNKERDLLNEAKKIDG